MKNLNKLYEQKAKEIAEAIQASEILEQFLEEEDDDLYKALIEEFEPQIESLYEVVALEEPLQLIPLEDILMGDEFEGLFIPKLMGFNILRSEYDNNYKYVHSNERFGTLLSLVCNSANFEFIKNRIGQSIQIGFAMSSDIWITGFLNSIENQKIKQYLKSQKLIKYLNREERSKGYKLYRLQFSSYNFFTTDFPTDLVTQRLNYHSLCKFLKKRAVVNENNSAFIPEYINYLKNDIFIGTDEHIVVFGLLINYFDLKKTDQTKASEILAKIRDLDRFNEVYFNFILERFRSNLRLTGDCDKRVAQLIDFKKTDDDLARYYEMALTMANEGYAHDNTIEKVKNVYNMYEGMSLFNECVRELVLGNFIRLVDNLDPEDYTEYFELDKYWRIYIDIFNNQEFNQQLRDHSVKYVKRCIKRFTDKRSRDYQDIKKFIKQQYTDLQFLKEKEIVELFKTKRKPRKPKAQ